MELAVSGAAEDGSAAAGVKVSPVVRLPVRVVGYSAPWRCPRSKVRKKKWMERGKGLKATCCDWFDRMNDVESKFGCLPQILLECVTS